MKQIGYCFLFMLVFSIYSEEKESLPVVSEVKELKNIQVKKIIWQKDKSIMVSIPAGSYMMGAGRNETEDWMKPAKPVHQVQLDGFYMDAYEVTVGQYKQFLAETGHSPLPDWVSQLWKKVATTGAVIGMI